MTDDELPLGLPPAKPKATRTPAARVDYEWGKYDAVNRRFCDVCISEIDPKTGIPKHALNKAMFIERGPEGQKWLCNPHKAARETALRKRKDKK